MAVRWNKNTNKDEEEEEEEIMVLANKHPYIKC